MTKLLITGGAGFIGSELVRLAILRGHSVVNLDCLTYAANLESLRQVVDSPLYSFEQIDIRDAKAVRLAFERHSPDAVAHLAAESHVDRSIDGPEVFIQTNIVGTYNLLEASRLYWETKAYDSHFRFLHVSTDEVFGSLGETGKFIEDTPYAPRSPYSASKAASDHLVRAWHHTFGLPTLITNCSNNYGPYQFPEKLIPVVILRALSGEKIPVYGTGGNVRDWLHVTDHADALLTTLAAGEVGKSYNIGGGNEVRNIDLVRMICSILDRLRPSSTPYADQIAFVSDRPGHDHRYAIDGSRLQSELGWSPSLTFDLGLERTIEWYLANESWWRPLVGRAGAERRLGAARQKVNT